MSKDFEIWYSAVTSFLRKKGHLSWCEGKVGGGYAIWGGDEVNEAISEFNQEFLKSNVRHGRLLDVNSGSDQIFIEQQKNSRVVDTKIERLLEKHKVRR